MGYTSPSIGAVANTGYPSCSDVSSALIDPCVAGRMYGEQCSIVVNNTSFFYSSCDSSPGHSGGPTFTTSGSSNILVGHIVANAGNIACANAVCPTQHTGTDSWLLDFQDSLRSQYDAVDLN
jgi:V8-like Glu-specific endopeptidase